MMYPQPPTALAVVSADSATGNAVVEWADAEDCHFWRVLLDEETQWRTARTNNRYAFKGLTADREYRWQVKAVREDEDGIEVESPPTRGPYIRFFAPLHKGQ